jgi:formylglycine-generating enzyme required for sulfatase activity
MKTKLCLLFTSLALFASRQPLIAQLTLSITPNGNQIVLLWPTTVTNWILQSTTNLASPNWVTVNNAALVGASNAFPVTAFTVTNTWFANFYRLFHNNTPITTSDGMTLIPAGSFTMGDNLDGRSDAIPTVSVTVSAFYMDIYLVSYSQWETVYSWATSHGYGFVHAGAGKAVDHPVYNVDWYDCVKWSNARSQQAGLTPVYYTDGGLMQVYTNGEAAPYVNWAANGYRLPTEAEWEKAVRGGVSGQRFPWGNTISESQANYYGAAASYSYDLGPNGYNPTYATGSTPYTNPVGSFEPNGYGLYMNGNCQEWCWDWYEAPYLGGIDPRGPEAGSSRVVRGGRWNYYASAVRCANRANFTPTHIDIGYCFRCVRAF